MAIIEGSKVEWRSKENLTHSEVKAFLEAHSKETVIYIVGGSVPRCFDIFWHGQDLQ